MTNSYGYHGHLSEAVFAVLDRHWTWSYGMGAAPIDLARGDYVHPSAGSFDKMLEGINPDYAEGEKRLRYQADLQILEEAGYVKDRKIDGDTLWADLNIAGLISVRTDLAPLRDRLEVVEPLGTWWHWESLRPSHFDTDGFLIARDTNYFTGDQSRAIAIVSENVRNAPPHERGSPHTPDEALLDASIGPRLASAANLGEPR